MYYDEVFDRQTLLFEIKLLRDQVSAFESGEKYVQMEKLHKVAREGDFRTMRRLRKELEEARGELEKKWSGRFNAWVTDSVQFWKEMNKGFREYDKSEAEKHISELMEILKVAREEYEYEPPTKYNREGYNLYKRMEEKPEEYVLFLRDPSVPPTNNIAERYARKFKRKAHQVMSFRSNDGVNWFCDGLSVMESIKATGGNLFEEIANRFNKNIEEWKAPDCQN